MASAEAVKTNRNGGGLISKMYNSDCFRLLLALLLLSFPSSSCSYMATAQGTNADDAGSILVDIGVVLDTSTYLGKMGLSAINTSLSDLYDEHPDFKTRLRLHVRNSKSDVLTSAKADLIQYVQAKAIIIGPETPVEAQFVIQIGKSAHVPIIAYSATSPLLSSMGSPYFIRASQDDSSQVDAISALMQAYEWRQAVPIYADSEFGGGPYLADALQEIGIRIPSRSVIPSLASDDGIALELDKLTKMETRVFIVHMDATLGRRLFLVAKKKGMMTGGYVWIITSGMASMLLDSDPIREDLARSMQGVLGVKSYVPASDKRNSFEGRWRKKFWQHTALMMQINVYGIWAYDAATALALAVEKIVVDEADQAGGTNNLKLMKAARDVDINSDSADSPSFADALSALARGFSASQQRVGQRLLEAILSTKFTGLSGHFDLAAGGQLHDPSVFELINIHGGGTAARLQTRIGYWTRDLGLVRELNSTDRSRRKGAAYSTLRENLTDISLPGYAKPIGKDDTIPKGWKIIPANGSRKLRIGIPQKEGFLEFVNVTYEGKKVINITGYCIDVFDAVMLVAGYEKDKDYEYVPYVKDGDSEGYYDRLIQQVPQQVYDAVVGDVTIVYNRSQYVEFTLPYKESGVITVEPIVGEKPSFFTRPLSGRLWATTFCLFIFIAFVIWALEHRINLQFRGSPTHQAGTSLYYSFSTLVFAHRQHVFNNLARVVVIVWVFVVLILNQSYTASLASILTVERLRPAVARIEELLDTNKSIGYQKGSFVHVLLHQMQFNKSQLKPYGSVQEMHRLFSVKEIDVAFDEIAFVKVLISSTTKRTTKCGGTPQYTMVGPTYRTDGFGFVFPKHSPLASYVSRAILNVTQGKKMTNITRKWFPEQVDNGCSDQADSSTTTTSTIASTRIGLKSFWVLFVMAGSVALFALLISATCFLYEHRHVWLNPADDASSITKRITELLRIFDQLNLQSPAFRTRSHGEPRHSSAS